MVRSLSSPPTEIEFSLYASAERVAELLTDFRTSTNRDLLEAMFATSYELALRSGRTPREVLDVCFRQMTDTDSWRIDLEPVLRKSLVRDK